jgi:predicted RNA-binding Zn-ribbon protein involved in translation (DUF1610 family)
MILFKNRKKKEKKKTMILCPACGGRELYYEAGLITGYKYHCKDCDYIGTFVVERDVDDILNEEGSKDDKVQNKNDA